MASDRLERRLTFEERISRRRVLAPPATVLVSEGEIVAHDTPIALGATPGGLRIIDVARELEASVAEVGRYLLCKPGDAVAAGQVLARRSGLRRGRDVRAPGQGTVVAIREGRLFLQKPQQPVVLRAGLPGVVVEVIPQQGAIVCCSGIVITGLLGTGGEAYGPLMVVCPRPDAPLTPEQIGREHAGAILVGGILNDRLSLMRMRQRGVAGVVVGGLTPNLIGLLEKAGFPILVIAGMGPQPLPEAILLTLRRHQGREVLLSGANVDARFGAELVLPLGKPALGPGGYQDATKGRVSRGALVRVTRAPYLGAVGRIVDPAPLEPSGAVGSPGVIEVRLEDGRRVLLPVANLEVLG